MENHHHRGTGIAALLIALGLLIWPHPVQAVELSLGCELMRTSAVDSTYSGYAVIFPFLAGEQLIITASPPSQGALTTIWLNLDNSWAPPYEATAPFPGTLTYTFPASGSYLLRWDADYSGPMPWEVSWYLTCIPAGTAAAGGSGVTEPFFQFSDSALGVDLDKARLTSDEFGALPLDVFEPGWWGVKIITAARFPALAGIDLTTVEVRCLNSQGQWTTDHVTPWSSSPTELRVNISQHGFCGIFVK